MTEYVGPIGEERNLIGHVVACGEVEPRRLPRVTLERVAPLQRQTALPVPAAPVVRQPDAEWPLFVHPSEIPRPSGDVWNRKVARHRRRSWGGMRRRRG